MVEEDVVGEVVVVEVDVVVEPLGLVVVVLVSIVVVVEEDIVVDPLVVVVLVSVVVVVVDGRSMGTLSSIEKSLSLR